MPKKRKLPYLLDRPTCSGEEDGIHYHDPVSMISNGCHQWKCPISTCKKTRQKHPQRKGKKRLEELVAMGKLTDRPSCSNESCDRFGVPMHKNTTHYRCPSKGCGCSVKIEADAVK
jgi:hypothetical protein